MTLFELWSAVASGAVGPRARAWRLGMECWTPVAEIEELALAALQAPASSEGDEDDVEELGDLDLVELLPDELSGSVAAALSAFPDPEAREGDEGDEGDEGARHALTPPAPPGALASSAAGAAPAAPGLSGRPLLESAPRQAEALVVAAAVWRLERGKLWIGLGALAASVALVLAPTLAGRGPSARALESGAEPASVAEPAPAPSPPSVSPDTLGRVDAPPPTRGPADVIPVAALPDAPGLRALPPPLPPPPEASAPRAEAGQRRLRARSAPAGGLARGTHL